MKTSAIILAAAFLPALASSFSVVPQTSSLTARSSSALSMADGFDKNKPAPKEKSTNQVQREQQSSKYDDIASTGGQEYAIFVRQFGGEDESWLPCGSIAVPRGSQVSDAIFANEGPLKTSIVRTFPKLQGFETEFEYGYNLKVYPDDPVEVAAKTTKSSGLSVGNWISTLLSPVDNSKGVPPS